MLNFFVLMIGIYALGNQKSRVCGDEIPSEIVLMLKEIEGPPLTIAQDIIGTSNLSSLIIDYCAGLSNDGVNILSSVYPECYLLMKQTAENFYYDFDSLRNVPSYYHEDSYFLHKAHIALMRVNVGRGSYGHDRVKYHSWSEPGAGVTFGRYAQIGNKVEFYLGGTHHYKRIATYPFDVIFFKPKDFSFTDYQYGGNYGKGPIIIGNDVWIADHVHVFSGVTIGDGAVIGASTVIRADVPPFAIMIGNPAQLVGYRFPPEQIEKLLVIKWWDWELAKIEQELSLLLSSDPHDMELFIEKH